MRLSDSMHNRISLVIPVGGSGRCSSSAADAADADADASPPYTPTPRGAAKRRSLIDVPRALIPGRAALHKLWPGSSSRRRSLSSPDAELKDWSHSDLSTAVRLAGLQMGALANPANPILPVPDLADDKWRQIGRAHV